MTRQLPKRHVGDISGQRVIACIYFVLRRKCTRLGGPFFEYLARGRGWTPHRRFAARLNPRVLRHHKQKHGGIVVRVVRWRKIGEPS